MIGCDYGLLFIITVDLQPLKMNNNIFSLKSPTDVVIIA